MSIGQDISEVLDELGMTVEIQRPDTDEYDWFREKIELSALERTAQPFYREYMVVGSFRYDTQIVSGDVLRVVATGKSYIVLSTHPEGFEDEIIEHSAYLYKCNTLGIALRQTDTGQWDSSYRNMAKWVPVHQRIIPVLFYDVRSFERTGETSLEWGSVTGVLNEVHISGYYNLPPLSRFRIFNLDKEYAWVEWEESISYNKKDLVFSSDYRLFKSIINDNLGNDPIYTSQDNYEDDYYVKCWQEIPHRDMRIGKADISRFENVIVYAATEDTR